MPKIKEIGGCAGTNCPTRKVLNSLDVFATRNVIKHHKLYNDPLQSVGKIILSVESYKDKSIFFCKFKANDSVKKNGFKSIEFKYTNSYKIYNNKQKQQAFDFVNNLQNLQVNQNYTRFLFVSKTLRILSEKIVKYVAYKGIASKYFNMRINLPAYNINYGILPNSSSVKATSTNSTSIVNWVNTNWYWPVAGAMALVGAGFYKLFTGFEDSELVETICSAIPEASVTEISEAEAATYNEIMATATRVVEGISTDGIVVDASAVIVVEEDEVTLDLLETVGLI